MNELTNSTTPVSTARKKGGFFRKWMLYVAAFAILVTAGMFAWMYYVPNDLDLSSRLPSEQGIYSVAYTPQSGKIAVNQMHSWTLHVETADGQPVDDAQIVVDGDMPQHGHGLPTRPQVTRSLGNGDYQIDGVKFHMPGWWVMDFEIQAGGKTDKVRFNLMLE